MRHRWLRTAGVAGLVAGLVTCASPTDDGGDGGDGNGNPSLSITLSNAMLSVQQGGDGAGAVTIARSGGFSGAVTLSAQGAPNGVTATGGTVTSGSNAGSVTIEVSPTADPGSYTLTVRGQGNGVSDATASLTLTVTEGSGGGGNIQFSFCAAAVPTFFAYQGGSGPWVAVQPDGQIFDFDLAAARGGVARVTVADGIADVEIWYASTAELALRGDGQCPAPATKTVNGTVAGLSGTSQATVTIGGASTAVGPPATDFTLTDVAEGTVDLIASMIEFDIVGSEITLDLQKMIIRRDLNPPDNSTLPVLDFGSAEAFDPVTRNLTINNLAGEFAVVASFFFTENFGAAGLFFIDFTPSDEASRTFPTVPAAQFQPGDLQIVSATSVSGPSTSNRSVLAMSNAPVDQIVALGAALNAVDVSTVAAAPYVRPSATYTVQADYDDFWAVSFSQANGNAVSISTSADYQGGAAIVNMTMPDLSGLAGWNNAWGLQQGSDVDWEFSANGWTGADAFFSIPFGDGVQVRIGAANGMFAP